MITIFNGSPRARGNTAALTGRIIDGLDAAGLEHRSVDLYGMDIAGCSNCGACQEEGFEGHCTIDDDMQPLYDLFLGSDTVLLTSPLYMWQLTPCMLAFLNRLHSLNSEHRNLMAGKKLALAVTLGADSECASCAVMGIIDFCAYFGIDFLGEIRIAHAGRDAILGGGHDGRIDAFVDRIRRLS